MPHLSRTILTLVGAVALALATGCSGDDDDDDGSDDPQRPACSSGSTQACTCSNGQAGAQTCAGDAWGQCVCDGQPLCTAGETQACICEGGGAGSQVCAGDRWGACGGCASSGPAIGDPCEATTDCEGAARPLRCVVEDGDTDIQGICTVVCSDWTDCTSAEIGEAFWDCCDLSNGSSACAPSAWECDG